MSRIQLQKEPPRRKLDTEGTQKNLNCCVEKTLENEVGTDTEVPDNNGTIASHTKENTTATNNGQSKRATDDQGQPPAKKKKRSKDGRGKQRQFSPTPGLCIRNLGSPLELHELQELLAQFGRIRALHLSQNQTHAFVYYEFSTEAVLARKRLYGLPFPSHTDALMTLEFVTAKRMGELFEAEAQLIQAGSTQPRIVDAPKDAPPEWYGLIVQELDPNTVPPPPTEQPPTAEEITSD
ncbi:Apoptotic chromatin condensation inducer in the nucleus [Dispira parvispora]|uniref:Apoptotic chromatin condensation inducer in the nucleus n=1 Tax=Dispira parvispora TaxID=1520584 RepID=A0A9W8E5G4_9FUNG|nr:Apoptotic chromatin condensation inducer in the nucleus [Dispira parvispora]